MYLQVICFDDRGNRLTPMGFSRPIDTDDAIIRARTTIAAEHNMSEDRIVRFKIVHQWTMTYDDGRKIKMMAETAGEAIRFIDENHSDVHDNTRLVTITRE